MEFKHFDTRNYPTVSPREGYARWAPTYDDSVLDLMDLRLLERIETIDFNSIPRCADLACGTGRTAAWLKAAGVRHIGGVDITPEMLDLARERNVHDQLHTADIRNTPLQSDAWNLITCSLADEHIPDLDPLYAEAARLADPTNARFILIGYHPFLSMGGMPTHFHADDGSPIAIETHVHLFSDHVAAAHAHAWRLTELHECLVDDQWLAIKPRWEDRRGRPVTFAFVWSR